MFPPNLTMVYHLLLHIVNVPVRLTLGIGGTRKVIEEITEKPHEKFKVETKSGLKTIWSSRTGDRRLMTERVFFRGRRLE